MTIRSALAGGCLALAMLTAATCAQLNEAITGRDLGCGEVPEDICVRVADHIVGLCGPATGGRDGPIVRVLVRPVDCFSAFERPDSEMARRWEVEATAAVHVDGSGGLVEYYYLHEDGTLIGPSGEVIGN